MIRTAIVEDDPAVVAQLRDYFDQMTKEGGGDFFITDYKNAIIFIEDYRHQFDLVLMDIEMPYMNGMKAAQQLRERDRDVTLIFVTNMAQYAVKGYEVRAFDFIVKPVNYYSFAMKIRAAAGEIRKKPHDKLRINTQSGSILLSANDIWYVESYEHSLTWHCDGGVYLSKGRESLTEVEQKLTPYGFLRCKSSYLVNINYIKSISGDTIEIADIRITLTRNRKKAFLEAMARYIGEGDTT